MSTKVYEKLQECYKSFREKSDFEPKVGLVLGSGLGDFADLMDVKEKVSYKDIKGFPVSTVPGHSGEFILGYIGDVPVVCMKGRIHYYEGYDISDVVLPTRLMKLMGIETLFVTNASGGINRDFGAGDMMIITDHISSFAPNPLIGPNIDELGVRFPDMTNVYDKDLVDIIKNVAAENNIDVKEGVYIQTTGPSFESPAEIKMFAAFGADAVGMSTVVEAIAARHMGLKVCGISCVCNFAAGISPEPLSHKEVLEAGKAAAPKFAKLVYESIKRF